MWITLIGTLGLLLLLASFALNIFGLWNRENILYGSFNVVGAGSMAWYAVIKDAPVLVALEGVWALVALVTMVLVFRRQKSSKPRPESGP